MQGDYEHTVQLTFTIQAWKRGKKKALPFRTIKFYLILKGSLDLALQNTVVEHL